MNNKKGFTLIELLVTMILIIVVILITASAFESILKNSARLVSSEESNIEGVIGLDMFRHDLQQMGLGLPSEFEDTPPNYSEATISPANKTELNDAPSGVPRAVASLESIGAGFSYDTRNILSGTDYLAIKATTVGRTKTSQQWTFLGYSSTGKRANNWPNAADNLTDSQSRVIVINRTYTATGTVTNKLVYDPSSPNNYSVKYTNDLFDQAFTPLNPQQTFYLYGVADGDLAMPFNRVDYFVARPTDSKQIPTSCAPNTGILYRANVNHGGGGLTYYPLLDCVADMQVVFGWDVNGDGVIDESGAYSTNAANIPVSSTIGTTAATIQSIMQTPEDIRSKLKYIKVYIMAQEGRRVDNYHYENNLVHDTMAVVVGNADPNNPPSNYSITKGYTVNDLTAKGWQNYRWKIYKIVVRPKSLAIN